MGRTGYGPPPLLRAGPGIPTPSSPLFPLPSLAVIDGTRAGELSLTIFPNTERRKCYGGGAGSIFVKEPVNVKPALIYSGEL